ncbi:MAG: hypothetical protein GKR94_26340 [Gammaproteobacteria bacterium]|nr:hypothetical protein [Gammaproteobacteria bacterium]
MPATVRNSRSVTADFPIIRLPAPGQAVPVIVSIPHFGCAPLPCITDEDYADRMYRSFRFGYADAFADRIYGELHRQGATVIATPYSRLFVDLNRRRDDFQCKDGEVRSKKGVFRTHTLYNNPVLKWPLSPARAQWWLCRFYDPYYIALEAHTDSWLAAAGQALLIDGHTGSPRRLDGYEVVLGTGLGKYCHPDLTHAVQQVLRGHGFACTADLSGYRGGAVVRRFGRAEQPLQAIQIEVNAGLIMRCSRRAYAESLKVGLTPAYDKNALQALQSAVADVVRSVGV